MIIVMITSGLGNQMYQYAMYKQLALRYPETTVKADITRFRLYSAHQGFELKRIFEHPGSPFHLEAAGNWEIFRTGGGIPIWSDSRLMRKLEKARVWYNRKADQISQLLGTYRIIDESFLCERCRYSEAIHDRLLHLDMGKDWSVRGYWEHEKYYSHILPQLRQDFCFPDIQDGRNREVCQQIRDSRSVSIHVRRGDYVGSQFDILTMEYYRSAVEWIRKNTDGDWFFLFSDDEAYAREVFSWLDHKTVVSHNKGEQSFRDMQLMSLCRHNIIANSTFSTWAGLLNENPGRRVVYPDHFTRGGDLRIRKLEGWHPVEVGPI